ncbi:MAG: biotin transporter BioY [Candidatus Limnocylindrales bacterium]
MIASERLLRVPTSERGVTLGDFLVPIRLGERISAPVRHALLVGLGTLLIIVGARLTFYLPGNPLVPVTLQTFGVLFGGAMLGFRRGVLAVLLYLVLGMFLPVFAYDQASGVYRQGLDTIVGLKDGQLVLGVTGGYLIGFVLASGITGRLAELGWDRHIGGSLGAMLLGSVAIYAVGLPWLAFSAHLDLTQTLHFGFWPFIPGDLVKVIAAALLLPAGWWLVSRRPSDR